MALGDLVLEEVGQVTGIRVLSTNESGSELEINLQSSGTIKGVEGQSMWTYTQQIRPDGSITGAGQGICTTVNGDVIHLTGHGSGQAPAPGGTTEFKVFIQPYSTSADFADLNTIGLVGEYTVNGDGTTVAKFWEWK